MKALQVTTPRSFTQVETVKPDLKTAGNDRILVQPEWASLCGSDIPFFTGNKRHKTYPLPIASPIHECVGKVIESRSNLFQPGDRVIAIPEEDQGLSEYFVAQDTKAAKLPTDLNDNGAACLIQPLSTVINAVDRLGDITGKSVAVIGLGSIGIFFCWMLKKRGVSKIIAIDPLPERCKVAARVGATVSIPARSIEVLHEARRDPETWDPPDICIEAVGHQMETLNDCLSLVKYRGTVLAFGVPDQPVYALEYETFFRKNANLLACVTPKWSEYLAISRDIFIESRADLETLVTHRLPVRHAAKAFEMYERHEDGIIKVLIDMSEW
jgi:threonine dehydrogenase-like Zn-dependent dehydrogenase